ncbi:hypothetical protein PVL29_015842 [Vitis rotundifolia]|uniref:Uncharacterized protein n=1 Tax=Vitis rotundifolia TaxID=103349 RepID=A0AA39DK04_VITRO|nr:hypothetical protein PVL29_015842 [Vitis rotundifolia]
MVSNLRVGFRKRQCKCLSKSITVNPSHSKKAYPKPVVDPLSKSTLPTIATVVTLDPNEKSSSVDDISYHEMRKPFVVPENISEESFECLHSCHPHLKTTYIPNRQEVSKLLSRIPSFTENEPPVPNIGVLFPTTHQILVEVDENPSQSFMARLPYSTPNTTIVYILHMKNYTAIESKKMVGRLLLFRL